MGQIAPDLVGDHEQVVSLGNIGYGCNFIVIEDAARRVVRVAKQDDLRRVVDCCFESFDVKLPAVGDQRHLDPSAAAVRNRIEERVIDRREHDNTVTRIGRVPECGFQGVQSAREWVDLFDVGSPPVSTFLPIGVRRSEVDSKRPIPEVATFGVGTDCRDDRCRRVEVHVGDPRREHIRTVLRPLDSDSPACPFLAHREQLVGCAHVRTVVSRTRRPISEASRQSHAPRRTRNETEPISPHTVPRI